MKDNTFIRIAVTGITGRMGKNIARECVSIMKDTKPFLQCYKNIVLGAAIARSGASVCNLDVSDYIGFNYATGIIITDSLESVKENFDILVDFSAPQISMEYLKFCVANNKNMIIGTTGLTKEYMLLIEQASKKIGIVYSVNFSIGITIMLKLLRIVAKVIGGTSDIGIIEAHHSKKKDIPSGTALMMRNEIMQGLSSSSLSVFSNNECVSNSDVQDIQKTSSFTSSFSYDENDIFIHSIRAGTLVGEHTAWFINAGESLEIQHKAFNRLVFVYGVFQAVLWLRKNKVGLFNMYDVVDI